MDTSGIRHFLRTGRLSPSAPRRSLWTPRDVGVGAAVLAAGATALALYLIVQALAPDTDATATARRLDRRGRLGA